MERDAKWVGGREWYTPSIALLGDNLVNALPHVLSKRRKRSLHPDLHRLEWTQKEICQKLRASLIDPSTSFSVLARRSRSIATHRSAQVDNRLVHAGKHLFAVRILENLVKAILSRALEGVADKGGAPPKEDSSHAFGLVYLLPGGEV